MTRPELEARRLSAIPDIESGMTQYAIAKRYKVSRMTAHRWKKALLNGHGLKSRKTPGRPPRMDQTRMNIARKFWETGPRKLLKVDTDHWTARLFAHAIKQNLGIKFSHDHVGRIMHQLGLR
jgi:transposase